MPLPSNPTNGQTVVLGLYTWKWNASLGAWSFSQDPKVSSPPAAPIPPAPTNNQRWGAGKIWYRRDNGLGVWNIEPIGANLHVVDHLIYQQGMPGAPGGYPYATGFVQRAHGGITNMGGSITPNTFAGKLFDAILWGGAGNEVIVALRPAGLPQTFFTSVILPGVNGGNPLYTADCQESIAAEHAANPWLTIMPGFGNMDASNGVVYDCTFWHWGLVSGPITDGLVILQ